ncbi:MAG: VanZ family protein [Pseudomonadota bacterium]
MQTSVTLNAKGVLAQSWLNALHIPWSMAVTLALFCLLGTRFQGLPQRLLTVLLALAAGLVTEVVQRYVPGRSASLADVFMNLTGTSAMIGYIVLGDRSVPRKWRGLLLAGAALLALSFPARVYWVLCEQRQRFPQLIGRDFLPASGFLTVHAESLSREGELCLRFDQGAYPGLSLELPAESWAPFRSLSLEVFLEYPRDVTLTAATHLRDDNVSGPAFRVDRFVEPGRSRVRFPVNQLIKETAGEVERLLIYGRERDRAARLCLLDLSLEG